MKLFDGCSSIESFKKSFLQNENLPVLVLDRKDLESSIERGNKFYSEKISPSICDVGIFLSSEEDKLLLSPYLNKLAAKWTSLDLAFDKVDVEISILICGIYKDLTLKTLQSYLMKWRSNKKIKLSFLTGRDLSSFSWVLAKQFVSNTKNVEHGFFSSEDIKKCDSNVKIYDYDDFETLNVQKILLEENWKSLVIQGHGKDDSINLGDYTVCGLNRDVAHLEGTLRPRCGYCNQECYKDSAKLIPLNEILAEEIVLSACNSAPLADLGLYDPKYLLLLNALDGVAKTVVAGLTVHDSSLPENMRWVTKNEVAKQSAAHFFNNSLQDRHPYPSFWEFGIKAILGTNECFNDPVVETVLTESIERAQSYIINNFLNQKHPLRERFEQFNYKFNQSTTREKRVWNEEFNDNQIKSLYADLESLDYAMASLIHKDPENDLMNYETYYADRSNLMIDSSREVSCSCGNKAIRYKRKGLYPNILNTDAEICFRCGDKKFHMENSPNLEISSSYIFNSNESVKATVNVKALQNGKVLIGFFVPSYLRNDVETSPEIIKKKMKKNEEHTVEIEFKFKPSVQAQAYYFTMFAIQNLAISTCRQHFGLEKNEK